MWDFPGPGLEPVTRALAGGFLTTAPLGKSLVYKFLCGHVVSFSLGSYRGVKLLGHVFMFILCKKLPNNFPK